MMVFPDATHIEIADQDGNDSIENANTGPFVWLVTLAASIAGSLFGYDTGIISAVLVYLNNDLNNRAASPNENLPLVPSCKLLLTPLLKCQLDVWSSGLGSDQPQWWSRSTSPKLLLPKSAAA
jgi:hypothetical protein